VYVSFGTTECGSVCRGVVDFDAIEPATPLPVGWPVPGIELRIVDVLENGAHTTSVRASLVRELPDFMVPSVLIAVAALPLTPHGKVDRQELERCPRTETVQEASTLAGGEIQQEVVGICAEVLEVERAGLADNFFDLGGHSLHATAVVSRIRARFGVEVPLRTIFEAATLGDFARNVEDCLSAPPARSDAPTKR